SSDLPTSQVHDTFQDYPLKPPSKSNPPITCSAKSEKSSVANISICLSYSALDHTSIFLRLHASTSSLPTSAYSNKLFGNKTRPAESNINSVAPLVNFRTNSLPFF